MLKRILSLPPHTLLFISFIIVNAYPVVMMSIGFMVFVLLGGISLGTLDSDSFSRNAIIVFWVGQALVAVFAIYTFAKTLIMSHRYAKGYGRGDEHWIFYTGLVTLGATWLFTRQKYVESTSSTDGSRDLATGLFIAGNVLGALLFIGSIILFIKLSMKLYGTRDA